MLRSRISIESVAFLIVIAASAVAQTTAAISVDAGGLLGNASSFDSVISQDGRFVAFTSAASNLVANDGNGTTVFDVFVRDLQTGVTTLESVSSASVQGDASSEVTAISPDGRWITFQGTASNLVPGDIPQTSDLFLRDRVAGTTIRLSEGGAGPHNGGAVGGNASFSSDGRWLAFESFGYLFVRELSSGATEFVSVAFDGTPARASLPSISSEGRWIAFTSIASNLVTDDTNFVFDVFVHDRDPDGNGIFDEMPRLSTNVRVSTDAQGMQSQSNSGAPTISDDGRWVCFYSDSGSLIANDTNRSRDVFVRDRDADGNGIFDDAGGIALVRVSVTDSGGESAGSSIFASATSTPRMMTHNGRFILFSSVAANLVAGDTNESADVFVHDRDRDGNGIFDEPGGIRNTRESVSSSGVQSSRSVIAGGISEDGRLVTFSSDSDDLVPGDQDAIFDVFLRSTPGRVLPLVSGVAPSIGSEHGGDRVEIRGTNLSTYGTHVDFGGVAAAIVESSATLLVVRTPAGSGVVDVHVGDRFRTITITGGFTYVGDDLYARYGNVNAGLGLREAVLRVNSATGSPLTRVLELGVGAPIAVTLASPSSRTTSRFAIYAWPGSPDASTLSPQPAGVGTMVFPTPLDTGAAIRPVWIGNDLDPRLGTSSGSFGPAPTLLGNLPHGRSRPTTVTLQGFVQDNGSISSRRVSVTNAVVISIH
ncbi:MAG: PD40 domain-containing protein [Planctomycetes bacterium]|nr:PD40 domain-containing protein [Planctomycetota bacterium]MBI3845695.1 PD40 domain-containing protein [Planctomycetota bacterium]